MAQNRVDKPKSQRTPEGANPRPRTHNPLDGGSNPPGPTAAFAGNSPLKRGRRKRRRDTDVTEIDWPATWREVGDHRERLQGLEQDAELREAETEALRVELGELRDEVASLRVALRKLRGRP